MKEQEKKQACEAFNKIEEVLAQEAIDSWKTPDFWENLQALERFVRFRKEFCPE